jgi:hypothetical protein
VVAGSNPVFPTKKVSSNTDFFYAPTSKGFAEGYEWDKICKNKLA